MENDAQKLKESVKHMLSGLNGLLQATEQSINSYLSKASPEDKMKFAEAMKDNNVKEQVNKVTDELKDLNKFFNK